MAAEAEALQAAEAAGAAAAVPGTDARAEAGAAPESESAAAADRPAGESPQAAPDPGAEADGAGAVEGPPEAASAPAAPPAPGGRPARAAGSGGRRGGAVARRAALDARAVDAAREVLVAGGAPADLAEEAVRTLGEGAADALRDDPWAVLGLEGVRVEHADAFARAALGPGCRPDDERRARALVAHMMELAAERGHTALAAEALKAALAQQAVPDPAAAVAAAVEDGGVLVFRDDRDGSPLPSPSAADGGEGDEDEDGPEVPLLLGLDRYALAEESLADGLVRLLRSFEPDDGAAAWEKAAADAPSPSAAELVRAVAGSGLVLHTGGEAARAEPAALVAAARATGLRAYAAAYTEDGRRRLARALDGAAGEDAAVTVEDLLEGVRGPGRSPDGSLALDLLAVLDAPQLSVVEATDLVEALPDGARLVLSGDPYALWSAGPGRVFADLLAARACPRVTSRTPDSGPIGELVSCVGEGELATVDAPDKEVVVVPVRDPREAVHRAVQLVADSVPRAIGVPAEHTQVIVPAHGGPVGTRALNSALKERLNPGPGRFAGFDPGDRVVHVPRPGRTLPGTVVGADERGLRLDCGDEPVLVPREEVAGTVRHGWAVTGHQAAGMRWPAVVVVVPGDAGALLSRSWVYTAFGRGERHLSVVQGGDQALAQAVAGPAAKERTTRLVSVLRELTADG
ncbi:helix-hairpin-helix domain-containing protein [Streptomyces sp. V4-01]|uniref:Helix-hairpin-helix domain-containing protein n=1 Tax=Actinacidiphila polyblastidii TaxID=3110430 RepID=A0ABU7PFX7_9ACTN|nr:helix-hairpin-helix domain-containing protein [Streptomyces sp. V4-01]